jgi:hypothetical protein
MEFIMSLLPKIEHPTFKIKIPSTEKTHSFRPFLVKEEKILLMAKESKSTSDILSAIRQIVINCSVDEKFDIDKLALFDLEYIFLKLRSISVDNVVKVAYRDNEDSKLYYFEVDRKICFTSETTSFKMFSIDLSYVSMNLSEIQCSKPSCHILFMHGLLTTLNCIFKDIYLIVVSKASSSKAQINNKKKCSENGMVLRPSP